MWNKWWFAIKSIARTYVSKFEALAIILTVVGVLYLLAQQNHTLPFVLVLAAWLIYLISKAITMFSSSTQSEAPIIQANPKREPERIKGGNEPKHIPIKNSIFRIWWHIIIVVVSSVILSVFISDGFQWDLILETFRNLWIIFAILIVVVSGLLILVMKYPLWTATFTLLLFTFIFLFASFKSAPIGRLLYDFINETFRTDILVGSITFLALAVAVVTVLKNRDK